MSLADPQNRLAPGPEAPTAAPVGEYPSAPRRRDQWIERLRPPRKDGDAFRPHGFFLEHEPTETVADAPTVTLLLTNRECPFRCVMCDLWKTAVAETIPAGAVLSQIDFAFAELRITAGSLDPASQIKLYNGGSFFDPRAIPKEDYPGIARRVSGFERVIVECHPAFVGDSCLRFLDELRLSRDPSRGERRSPALEVAMGLETAHPVALEKLNKRMSLGQFARAAEFLHRNEISLRVFVLVRPPFIENDLAPHWVQQSIDFALSCHARVVSLILTRPGNGAVEALELAGQYSRPSLSELEQAQDYGMTRGRGIVFADLWDVEQFSRCTHCLSARLERLQQMNRRQQRMPSVTCPHC